MPHDALAGLPGILGGEPAFPEGPPDWPLPDDSIRAVFDELWASGDWGRYHGPWCDRLVETLRGFLNVEHCRLCPSGTAALELALRGIPVGDGDEVVLAAYDYKPNFQSVLAVGATPVLVDVDRATRHFDPDQLAAAFSPATKAVIVSHLHGAFAPVQAIMQIAAERRIAVIEDACQATGAMLGKKRAGTVGDVGIWSFGGSKLLSAGRGGTVFTDNPSIAQRIQLYAFRGNEAFPLSEFQAAVVAAQMESLEERNRIRLANAVRLSQSLPATLVPFAREQGDSTPTYYKLGMIYDPDRCAGLTRELFCKSMRADGIAIDPGFRSLHRVHSRRRFRQIGELEVAGDTDEKCVVLHHPVLLSDPAAMNLIASAIDRVLRNTDSIVRADITKNSALRDSLLDD